MAEQKKPDTTKSNGPVETPDTAGSRNVLTEDLPAPPGVRDRRARRARRNERTGPFVKYVGNASHRVIRESDWGQLGIKDGKEVVWEPKNDYMVESKKFSEEQLDYLLIDDMMPSGGHSFVEVDYEEDDEGNRHLVQVIDDED
jgi:hypothetical protein